MLPVATQMPTDWNASHSCQLKRGCCIRSPLVTQQRLATTLVATINRIFFLFSFLFFFFSVVFSSHRRSARIKTLTGAPKNLRDFWDSYRSNDWLKKLILRKLIWGSNNLGFDLFPDPVGHFGLSRWWGGAGHAVLQAVRWCRQFGIAGGADRKAYTT